MKTRKLLASAALLTTTFVGPACKGHWPMPSSSRDDAGPDNTEKYPPPPGNPKGSFYVPDAISPEAPPTPPGVVDAGKKPITKPTATVPPLPGNPKGSHYQDDPLK